MQKLFISIFLFVLSYNVTGQSPVYNWGSVSPGNNMAVDLFGNIYITGSFSGIADLDPGIGNHFVSSGGTDDILICKFDSAMNFIWAITYQGKDSSSGFGYSIEVDRDGNIFTCGYFTGTIDFDNGVDSANLTSVQSFFGDIFITKYNNSGQFVWAHRFGGINYDIPYDMTIDDSSNVYIAGSIASIVDFDPGPAFFDLIATSEDPFILKLDSSGNFDWARQLHSSNEGKAISIAIDSMHNVYTAGVFHQSVDLDPSTNLDLHQSSGEQDIFINKLDLSGNFIWGKTFGGPLSDRVNSIALGNTTDLYLTGLFQGTVDFDPDTSTYLLSLNSGISTFVQKLDSSGNFLWARDLTGSGTTNQGITVVADRYSNNGVYCAGSFQDTIDFDPSAAQALYVSEGLSDGFVWYLDSAGNYKWVKTVKGSNDDLVASLKITLSGNLIISGSSYSPSVKLDSWTLWKDTSLYRMNFVTELSNVIFTGNKFISPGSESFILFPNPAHDLLNLSFVNGVREGEILITDITGHVLIRIDEKVNSTEDFKRQINISNLSSGIYYLKYFIKGNRTIQLFVKE
jgi:hypothetical protein